MKGLIKLKEDKSKKTVTKKATPKKKTVTKTVTTQKKKAVASKKTVQKDFVPVKKMITEETIKDKELKPEIKEKSKDSKIVSFFNNHNVLLTFTLLVGLIAILLAMKFASISRIYTFGGFNDILSVDSGMIATTNKFAAFEGNNFNYKGEDIKVVKYRVGYFLKSNEFKTEIVSISGSSQTPKSLKEVLNSIVGFNFSEPMSLKSRVLDKEALQMINDGKLYFIIEYEKKDELGTLPGVIELQLRVSKRM